jgi:Protein of unknown function (DUF3365)
MKNTLLTAIVASLFSASTFAGDLEDRAAASRAAIKEFATSLQGELGAAIKAGGPVNAIEVCSTKAPAIAADISKKQGWKVARTSLKLRNPKNAPDAWEAKVLKEFEARKAKGEDPAQMEYSEIIVGKHEFRYMKAIAIPANAPCLTCHGDTIDPAVGTKLKTLYPQDQATGYKQGDVRGAFTITQPM